SPVPIVNQLPVIGVTPPPDNSDEATEETPADESDPRDTAQKRPGPEAAVPGGVVADRAQEVDLAEGRTVGLAEPALRVRRLPQQEARQPLLPRRADDEVGVGLAGGVEVLGDVVDVEHLGELLDRRARLGVA